LPAIPSDLPPTYTEPKARGETPAIVCERLEWRGPPSGDSDPSAEVTNVQLQRLREWKSRCVMPESIEAVAGFRAGGVGVGEGDGKALASALVDAWTNERRFREWDDQTGKQSAQLARERVQLLVANKAVSEYGERLPTRRKGDVFAPYASRPL